MRALELQRLAKGTSQDEAMLNSEEIKSVLTGYRVTLV